MAEHPYYPTDIVVPGFVPGTWSFLTILAIFGVAVVVVNGVVWNLSRGWRHLSTTDRLVACWWVSTGLIHLALEGAFVANTGLYTTPAARTNFLVELWKEYAKGDSRYATRDSFVVAMEGFTAFVEGPACFLAVYAMATKKPYRHTLQLVVSFGQFYGDVLYFLTCYLEGLKHSAPGVLYFWFYFIFMNSIWIVVPFLIMLRTWLQLSKAVRVNDAHSKQQ